MKINDEIILVVEKFVNEGKCISHFDNHTVFIENVCPGDEIRAVITKIKKSCLFASCVEVIRPSEFRKEPFCAMQKICGSCDRQFIKYECQLQQKEAAVKETLNKYIDGDCCFENILPSPKIKGYRCKVQYPVSQTKNSKRLLTGYYKKNSHELVNIKYCPMHANIISEINEDFKLKAQELGITGYFEKTHTGLLRHIIYRISSDNSQILVILVVNSDKKDKKLLQIAEYLSGKYPEIKGVCINYNDKRTNVITGNVTEILTGTDYYIETVGNKQYKISKTGFFQVNPYCAKLILDKVKQLITSYIAKPTILDAYAGVSAFGIYLSDIAEAVTSIEEVKTASLDASENVKINNVNNLTVINGDAANEFDKLIKQGELFDVSVTDPPRKGCSVDSVKYLSALTKSFIIYVSCNPVTLARDLELFLENGFRPIYIQPFDMFPHTYHVETVVMLKRV